MDCKIFQLLVPSLSTSNVYLTGSFPPFFIHPFLLLHPLNKKGSEVSPALIASLAQTAPSAVAGPNSSGLVREVNHKLEFD